MILETFFQDLRIGLRVLFKEKSFCALAVFVLAVGICGVTTMFSVIDGVLLRGMPFPEPAQLVDVQWRDPKQPPEVTTNLLPADYLELRPAQRSFTDLAAYLNLSTINITITRTPQRLQGAYVTENFFSVLGVKPVLGRDFTADDNRPEAPRVALISHTTWQHEFNGARGIVGQTVRLNGRAATIIGVMPPGFAFPQQEQIWLPLFNTFAPPARNFQVAAGLGIAAAPNVGILARLKPGVTLAQAGQEWDALAARLAGMYPDTNKLLTEASVRPLIQNFVGRNQRMMLYLMFGAVVGVLLIACVNVMNMQFARATLRHKELAVRNALGATRARLVRQMLTENVLLAGLGAVAGVLLSLYAIDLFNEALAIQIPPPPSWVHFAIDPRVLAFTVGVAMLAAVGSGLLPAFLASRANAADALKDAGRGNTSRATNVLTRGLVITQIGLACALLVLSTLVIRSVVNQQRIDYGYDPGTVLAARVGLFSTDDYPAEADRRKFYERVLRELRATPGIASAAVSSRFRMIVAGNGPYEVDGVSYATERDRPQGSFENVSEGYFETLGLKVIAGRDFTSDDNDARQPVVIVSASFARKNFGTASAALGRKVRPFGGGNSGPWRTVVGVAPDTVMQAPPFSPTVNTVGMFIPLNVLTPPFATLLVRPPGGSPHAIDDQLRKAVAAVDPNLPLYFVETPRRAQDDVLAQNRILATMFSLFGGVATLLAAVGVYGVMAFAVNQRTQEFGVRMALGAGRRQILVMVLDQGGRQLFVGLALGLLGALLLVLWFTGAYAGLFFGVNRFDPAIYGFVVLLLSAVAALSCLVPALRATRVDPMVALRAE
ncbi:ABC transporter permease [Opitutus sp. GAS368]|uniref:ABC transporter permease n=1 Tax=Opitutus sp. GAS368 TaxID=1882749 RepID=UPI00087BAD77|nr:ABC transporter permease [Opitutus sp. GAS368]SDS66081.1 duplicated orphan permease [Opitutus sp. GAS368]